MGKTIKVVLLDGIQQLNKVLNDGGDVNEKDDDGRTPLIHAVIENKTDMVKMLIKNGADTNIQDFIGCSALHYAAQNYLVDICKLLLENKASVDVKDNYGNTPLFKAVFYSKGKGEVIDVLRLYQADINSKNESGVSPLQLAKTIGNYNVLQFMK